MRSPEQATADDALEKAIRDCAVAYETVDADQIVTGFVVGFHATTPHANTSRYGVLFPDTGQAPHVSLGLLRMATMHVESFEDADDE